MRINGIEELFSVEFYDGSDKDQWNARATYKDGYEVDELFPVKEYATENEQQYELEWWLLSQAEEHNGIEWFSVDYVNKENNND